MYKQKLKIIQYNIFNIIPFNKSSPMKNYSSYLPHIASKILKTMTLPCAICCSPCRMTLWLCQLPCGIVTCHCHMALNALPPPCGKKKLQPRLYLKVFNHSIRLLLLLNIFVWTNKILSFLFILLCLHNWFCFIVIIFF